MEPSGHSSRTHEGSGVRMHMYIYRYGYTIYCSNINLRKRVLCKEKGGFANGTEEHD